MPKTGEGVSHSNEQTLEHLEKRQDNSQIGKQKWVVGIFFIILGTLMYGSLEVVVKLTQTRPQSSGNSNSDHDDFSFSSILVLSETTKFTVSVLFLYLESSGIRETIQTIGTNTWMDWIMFAIPAITYAVTNSLDWHVTKLVDPAMFKTLSNIKILTTSLLWWIWFRKPLSKQQIIALILLCVGVAVVTFPNQQNNDYLNSDHDHFDTEKTKRKTMEMVSVTGLMMILVQSFAGAFAAVYTEAIYKKHGHLRSLHLENMSMYLFGMITNFCFHVYTITSRFSVKNDDHTNKTELIIDHIFGLFYGFNKWCFVAIFVFSCLGLVVSAVLKRFDGIVKVLMNGAAVIISGMLNWLFLDTYPSSYYTAGSCVVIVSILLYQIPLRSKSPT